jgi:hypothetical protein
VVKRRRFCKHDAANKNIHHKEYFVDFFFFFRKIYVIFRGGDYSTSYLSCLAVERPRYYYVLVLVLQCTQIGHGGGTVHWIVEENQMAVQRMTITLGPTTFVK